MRTQRDNLEVILKDLKVNGVSRICVSKNTGLEASTGECILCYNLCAKAAFMGCCPCHSGTPKSELIHNLERYLNVSN